MRYSEMFLPTGREIPSDAEVVSHQLMIRAGMIQKINQRHLFLSAAGLSGHSKSGTDYP